MNDHDDRSAFERWEAAEPAASPVAADEAVAARERGYVEGYAAGQRAVADDAERLRVLLEAHVRLFEQLDARFAESLRDLALDVARQIVGGELAARPEHILDVIREVLQQVTETTRESRLLVDPADAALVRARLETTLDRGRSRLVEDARVVRGGCRIETPHGDIDATLQTRWRQVAQALGRIQNWAES